MQPLKFEMDKQFHLTLHWACDYLSVLGLKSIYVNKKAPRERSNYCWHIETETKWPTFCRQYQRIFLDDNCCVLIQSSLIFFLSCAIKNKTVLVQIMAWPRKDDTPLSEPMMASFTYAYVSHSAQVGWQNWHLLNKNIHKKLFVWPIYYLSK